MKKISHYTEQFINRLTGEKRPNMPPKEEEQQDITQQPQEEAKGRDFVALRFSDGSVIRIAISERGTVDLSVLSCILLAEHRKGGDPDSILKQLGVQSSFLDTSGSSIYRKPTWR